jgi:hypothetical protein
MESTGALSYDVKVKCGSRRASLFSTYFAGFEENNGIPTK